MAQKMINLMTRRLIGGFAYFSEAGFSYTPKGGGGSVTVSESVAPGFDTDLDAQPSLGCIEQVQFGTENDDQTYYCPKETGGYQRKIERIVIEDYIDITTQNDMEMIQRLELGVKNEITEGTPQTPFEQVDRAIKGWLYLVGKKSDGSDLLTMQVWVEFRLNTNPAWSREAGRPVLRAQVLANSLNEVEWPSAA